MGLIATGAAIMEAATAAFAAKLADSGGELLAAGDCGGNSSGARRRSGEEPNGFRFDGEYDEPSDEVGDVNSDCGTCCLS